MQSRTCLFERRKTFCTSSACSWARMPACSVSSMTRANSSTEWTMSVPLQHLEAEQPQRETPRAVDDHDQRPGDAGENAQGPGRPQGHAIRSLNGQRFGEQFAEDDVQKRDDQQRQHGGHGVRGQEIPRRRQVVEEALPGPERARSPTPCQGETGQRDAELGGRDGAAEFGPRPWPPSGAPGTFWLTISSTRVLRTATRANSAATKKPLSTSSTGMLSRPTDFPEPGAPEVLHCPSRMCTLAWPPWVLRSLCYHTDSARDFTPAAQARAWGLDHTCPHRAVDYTISMSPDADRGCFVPGEISHKVCGVGYGRAAF